MKKGFAPILIVLIIIFVLLFVYLLSRSGIESLWQPKISTNDGGEISTKDLTRFQKELSSPTPTTDETANWKTYKDEVNGFSFKYPNQFTPFVDKYKLTNFVSEENTVSWYIAETGDYKDEKKYKTLKENLYGSIVPEVIQRNGLEIARAMIQGEGGIFYSTTITNYKKYLILVFSANNQETLENNKHLEDQILSTFKFTD